MKTRLLILSSLFNGILCRDFILGMFKKNDLLVASDTFYKEITTKYGYTVGNYGRMFHCPITYFRISDRLGLGRPPKVQITRGGLRKKYIVVRMTASYGQPIGVNIYVGCQNDLTTTKPTPTTTVAANTTLAGEKTTTAKAAAGATGDAADEKHEPAADGEETPAPEEAESHPAEGEETPAPEGGDAAAAEDAEEALPAEDAPPPE